MFCVRAFRKVIHTSMLCATRRRSQLPERFRMLRCITDMPDNTQTRSNSQQSTAYPIFTPVVIQCSQRRSTRHGNCECYRALVCLEMKSVASWLSVRLGLLFLMPWALWSATKLSGSQEQRRSARGPVMATLRSNHASDLARRTSPFSAP